MQTPNKIILIDRDGVFNQDRSDYVRTPAQLVILPKVPEAISRLNQAGFGVLIITNQAGVGKGLISPETLEAIHTQLKSVLASKGGHIHAIYHCPHLIEEHCNCRKPKPGMILQAQKQWGFIPKETWMVGDSTKDLQAALAAGCRPALVLTGHGTITQKSEPKVPTFADLPAFVDFLLNT